MSNWSPFAQQGALTTFTAGTTASTGVQVTQYGYNASPNTPTQAILAAGKGSGMQCNFINSGTGDAFIGVGTSQSEAQTNAVIPTAGTNSSGCFMIMARSEKVLTFGPNSWFSGIVASGSSVIMVSCGEGN